MSYDDERDAEHLSALKGALEYFRDNHYDPGRKLIILFPGGIGSQLNRATGRPFPLDPYYCSWLHLWRVFLYREAENLQIEPGGRDFGGKYIIPDAEIGLELGPPLPFPLPELPALSAYGGFKAWCHDNKVNLFVFGWDWRRGVLHSAEFFLDKAVQAFTDAGISLNGCVLLGHSAGGMVVKVIANHTANAFVQQMDKAITVATPFYGQGAQIQRYMAGIPTLNVSLARAFPPGEDLGAEGIAGICGTMLGGYEFMYMDEATYTDGTNVADFKASTEKYKLLAYPSVDLDDGNVADPFHPQDAGGLFRFAPAGGFQAALKNAAIPGVHMVAQDLDSAVANKFYCIRGIQLQDKTPIGLKWKRVPAAYDCDTFANSADYPFEETPGPGDGFLAAWGTRLLRLPANHVKDVEDDLEHELMLNKHSVQKEIGLLLGIAEANIVYPGWIDPILADLGDVGRFFSGMRDNVTSKYNDLVRRAAAMNEYLSDFKLRDLRAIFNRAIVDLPKSPRQLAEFYATFSKKR